MKHFNLTWAVLACLSFANITHGQCTLACNDLVNVNLPQDGFVVITAAMVLNGAHPFCPGPKIISVTSPDGDNLHDTVTCAELNFTLMYSVFDQNSGSSCWGSLFIQDYTPPTITCPDLTVDCTDDLSPSSLGYATVTDNCDDHPNLTFSGQPVIQPCNSPNSAILLRTWQAVDASGNHAAPCVQRITVKPPSFSDIVFPPNKDGIEAPAIPCSSHPNTSPSVTGVPKIDGKPVTDFCKMVVTYEDLDLGGCANEKTIIRSWTVLNCCTNAVLEHNQIIKVADDIGPVMSCADTLIFSANGPGCKGTFFLPAMTATDNCSASITWRTLTPWGVLQSNGGMAYALATGTYTVTYEAKDACGNVSTCPVKVIVADNVAPVAICREYTVAALSSTGFATVTAAQLDNGSYDACCTNVFLTVKRMDAPANAPFTASVQFTCADAGLSIPVIMQATDCQGNKNTCMVQVAVQDKTAPMLVCPAAKTIPCSTLLPAPVTLTGSPTITEACGLDTVYFSDAHNFNMCHVGTITRTFTAVDNFGWTASCTQTIKLVDNTPVQFFFPPDTIVSCDRPLDSLASGQPTVISDCEMFGLNAHDEILPINCGLKIFRTFSYLEWCTGWDTAYTQVIRVVDDAGPVWADPVGFYDKVFLCGSDVVKPPAPTAIDYCSLDSAYVIADVFTPGSCPNRFTRKLTYEAVDTCGNVSVPYVQTIIVNDTLPPYALPMPAIGPFTCYSNIPAPNVNDVLGVADNCIGPVTVTWVSDGPNPGCSGAVIRTYRLQDACGNSATIAQQINIKDNVPPTADPLPTLTLPCPSLIPPPNVNIVTGEADNCGGPVTVAYLNDVGNPGCTGTVTRTYTLTDACGNSSKLVQLFNINDNVPPNASWVDTIRTSIVGLTCEKFVQVIATATDNCPGNPVTISNSYNSNGANASGFYPVGVTVVIFTFRDGCGNTIQHQTVVIVREAIAPSNFCRPFDVSLDTSGFAAIDIQALLLDSLLGGEDLCTTVTYQLSPDTLTCANMSLDTMPGGVVVLVDPSVVTYSLTVTDEFGNSSSCTNSIILSDPFDVCEVDDDLRVVSGRIFNEYREPLLGVEVQLIDGENMSQAYTANLGLFSFNDIPAGMSCELRPVKNTGLLNGVTTYDMVLLSNHILGTQLLDSPYKLIAADVNNSGNISTFDIVALRKAILHMAYSFPNNAPWRFVRADYEFPNPNNPFAEPFPEQSLLDEMNHDMPAQNFVAVKIGDLNGSVVLNPYEGEVEERNQDGELTLAVPNWTLKAGQEVRIPIACGEEIDLTALQGTFDFDAAKATFIGALPDGLERLGDESFGEPRSGLLTLGWHDANGQLLEAGTTLFYLQFKVHQDATVEEILAMNSTITPAIAYTNGGIPLNVRWRIHEASQLPVDVAPLFTLGQNRPNPFSGQTRIEFMLKEKCAVQLEMYDLNGRRTILLEGMQDAGWHEVLVSRAMMGGPGVYIYQLTTPAGTERRKMVFQ